MGTPFVAAAALIATLFITTLPASATAVPMVQHPQATQSVTFSVHLPLRDEAQLESLIGEQGDPHSPLYRHFLSVAQFRAAFGPTAAMFARAAAALRARGLQVVRQTSLSLEVSGPAAAVERTFQTQLGIRRDARGVPHVGGMVPLTVPPELTALGAAVTGLEPRVHFHVDAHRAPQSRNGPYGEYWFDDLKEAYTYPSDRSLDGKGAKIGVLMASDVLDSDTQAIFDHERFHQISGKALKPLRRVVLFGGAPFDPLSNTSFEASVDVQTAIGSAPGAEISLYNIPDLGDDSTIGAYIDVVEENYVDVLSSSFESCELYYTAAYFGDETDILRAFHEIFEQGNAQGISFVASSGDSGGLACLSPSFFNGDPNAQYVPSVNFPASDPAVTAVGGTNLQTTTATPGRPLRSQYVAENAFGDPLAPAIGDSSIPTAVPGGYWGSGSGASAIWRKPWYQFLVDTHSNRRTVPDISMQMGGCPFGALSCNVGDSSSIVAFGGSFAGAIGTSLSAPEFAGLLALEIGATRTRMGNANAYIYELAAANDALPRNFPFRFFHQGIPGNNGVVTVPAGTRGYNPIIGVGTPYARNFLGFPQLPLAGDPQTPSNP